jgi:hypothetical protein
MSFLLPCPYVAMQTQSDLLVFETGYDDILRDYGALCVEIFCPTDGNASGAVEAQAHCRLRLGHHRRLRGIVAVEGRFVAVVVPQRLHGLGKHPGGVVVSDFEANHSGQYSFGDLCDDGHRIFGNFSDVALSDDYVITMSSASALQPHLVEVWPLTGPATCLLSCDGMGRSLGMYVS